MREKTPEGYSAGRTLPDEGVYELRRRSFISGSVTTAAVATVGAGCSEAEKKAAEDLPQVTGDGKLAGFTYLELEEMFRHDLFDRYLPFFLKYMVDYEYGGFFPYTGFDGSNKSGDTKTAWWLGRGIWMISFLYNHLDRDERYLEIARKAAEILLRNKPDGNALWEGTYDLKGKPLPQQSPRLYNDMFAAEGLAELAQATGNDTYWAIARETVLKCMRLYDSPDYEFTSTYGLDVPPLRAPRIVGHWMVFLITITKMLRYRDDPDLSAIADRCVDAILNYHMNPEFGLLNEIINHDLSRPDNEFSQFSYTSHGLETLWMVMWEAERRGDSELFKKAAEGFKRHVQVSWDDVYGGVFQGLVHVDENRWQLNKSTWAQVEVLVGCLLLVEHSGEPWAGKMFGEMYTYFRQNYSLEEQGCPMWLLGGDRKLDPYRRPRAGDNYHIPRWLMLNLLSLERIIARDGKISQFFE